jgi:hypothetical protein
MFVPGPDGTTTGATLSRMASIPHGTAINAQAIAPAAATAGAPTIPAIDIRPFVIGNPSNRFDANTFPSLDITNTATRRIPQDLSKFNNQGTITKDILADPNTFLRNAIKDVKIIDNTVIQVSTKPKSPELGGGIANIDFLEGSAGGQPNADAIEISATFWIETVEWTFPTPKFGLGSERDGVLVTPQKANAQSTAERPSFRVFPPRGQQGGPSNTPQGASSPDGRHGPPALPPTITTRTTQIPYSQLVNLNFAGLTWPHVSVATLRPNAEVVVQM